MIQKKHNPQTFLTAILANSLKSFNSAHQVQVQLCHSLLFNPPDKNPWHWQFTKDGVSRSLPDQLVKSKMFYTYFCYKGFKEKEEEIEARLSKSVTGNYMNSKQVFRNKENMNKSSLKISKMVVSEVIAELGENETALDYADDEELTDYKFLLKVSPDEKLDYFFIANRKMIREARKTRVGQKISGIYSIEQDFDFFTFFRVDINTETRDVPLTHIQKLNVIGSKLTKDMIKRFKKKNFFDPEKERYHKNYFSRSTSQAINHKLDRLAKDLLIFFSIKSKLRLTNLSFTFLVINWRKYSKIVLIDTKDIGFKYSAGDTRVLDFSSIDSMQILDRLQEEREQRQEDPRVALVNSCKGLYCHHREFYENAFIDEKDELNNLYLMESDELNMYEVDYKSIILDLIEKIKTIQRVSEALTWAKSDVIALPQGLLIKFRKFYTITDLKKFELLSHIQYAHMYHKKKVCSICYAMYNKLDSYRTHHGNNRKNAFLNSPELIKEEVKRYLAERGKNDADFENMVSKCLQMEEDGIYESYPFKSMDRKILSKRFFREILSFDTPKPDLEVYKIDQGLLSQREAKLVFQTKLRTGNCLKTKLRKSRSSAKILAGVLGSPSRGASRLPNLAQSGKSSMRGLGENDHSHQDLDHRSSLKPFGMSGMRRSVSVAKIGIHKVNNPFGSKRRVVKVDKKTISNAFAGSDGKKKALEIFQSSRNVKTNSGLSMTSTPFSKRKLKGFMVGRGRNSSQAQRLMRYGPKVTTNQIRNNSLRLHMGTKRAVKAHMFGNITTASSLNLTKLENQIKKVEKIAKKNRNGNIGISEKKLLKLIMCPYKGNGELEKSQYQDYIKKRRDLVKSLGFDNDPKIATKKDDYEHLEGFEGLSLKFKDHAHPKFLRLDKNVLKVQKQKNMVKLKENVEKEAKKKEDMLVKLNPDLAYSVLDAGRRQSLLGKFQLRKIQSDTVNKYNVSGAGSTEGTQGGFNDSRNESGFSRRSGVGMFTKSRFA